MCTVVILRRPGHAWPVILGANRDEMADRPWLPPARHWPDRPEVVAGLDQLAGGSWMGLNDHGVVACALNREGALGPQAGKRSRGELVLEALDHADAAAAAQALGSLDPDAYRPFNLLVADNRDVFVLIARSGSGRIDVRAVPPGLTMLTAGDPDDLTVARVRLYRPQFLAAPAPDPDRDDWSVWQALLAAEETEAGAGPRGAMNIATPGGFGTGSSALLALPAMDRPGVAPRFLFAAGRPGSAPWQPVLRA